MLRGDHEAVTIAPQLWIRTDATSEERGNAVVRYRLSREAEVPRAVDPRATRILGPIPPERRRVALRNYVGRDGLIVHKGDIWDANDRFVAANEGDLFAPEAA